MVLSTLPIPSSTFNDIMCGTSRIRIAEISFLRLFMLSIVCMYRCINHPMRTSLPEY